jgi:pimeloyl-ACP methyl ester carboxylesterase
MTETKKREKRWARRGLLRLGTLSVAAAWLTPQWAEANRPAATRWRGYARGPHGLVHYQDTGPAQGRAAGKGSAAALPLILLHQAPMSSRQFDSVYGPLLARGIRAIGIDTPGFGLSDPTAFVPQVADWTSSVIAVLDHLRIRRCDVLGHHTGALLATEVALQYPKRVRRLIVNGPFPINEEERQQRLQNLQKSEIDFVYKDDGMHLAESFRRRSELYGAGADPKLMTRYTVEKFQGYAPFWYGHNAAYRYDHAAALKRVRQRTLVLANTGDMIYPLVERVRTLRPDFSYVALQGGGIDIIDQDPNTWADAVAQFVKS